MHLHNYSAIWFGFALCEFLPLVCGSSDVDGLESDPWSSLTTFDIEGPSICAL